VRNRRSGTPIGAPGATEGSSIGNQDPPNARADRRATCGDCGASTAVRDRIGAATIAASPRVGEVRALHRARPALARRVSRRNAARVTSERSGVVTRAANAVTTPPAGRIFQCLPNYGLLHWGQIRYWAQIRLIRGHCGSLAEGAHPRLRSNRASAQPDQKLRNNRKVIGPSSNTDPRVAVTYRADARHSTSPARAHGLPCSLALLPHDHHARGHSPGEAQRSTPCINVCTSQRR